MKMKYKTKEIVVETEDAVNPEFGNVYISHVQGSGFINKHMFDLLFEPLEEDKQETLKCSKCKREYSGFNTSLTYDAGLIFCVECYNNGKGV